MQSKIETAYILCAGMGTRMGPLGKVLPKVMWPVFECIMLDLQLKYARSLGMKTIYINVHHCENVIIEHINKINSADVTIIQEKELLDSGGAIHNLINQYKLNEKILILNGDQFLFSDQMSSFLASCMTNDSTAILLETKVKRGDIYNRLFVENGLLTKIIPNNDVNAERYSTTYSGVAVIDLAKLDYVSGASKFFDTVANFKSEKISCKELEDYEYWDFGTIGNFISRHNEIIDKVINSDVNSGFVNFILNEQAVIKNKVYRYKAYDSKVEMNYIFSTNFKIIKDKIFYQGREFLLE
jgi:choline kinase